MKIKLENITPAKALEFLKNNTHNRPVSEAHVGYLASEMVNGRFCLTHQGICISEDGTLLDGQHRLLGVVRSQQTVQMYVARGAEAELQVLIDNGIKPRTVGDQLHLVDGLKDANIKVAAIRQIVSICCFYQSVKLSTASARSLMTRYERELDFVISHVREFKPARRGWIMGALVFAYSADRAVAPFIHAFGSGEGLKTGDPAKAARNWLIEGANQSITASYKRKAIEGLLNAAYNSCTNRKISMIKKGTRGIGYFLEKQSRFVGEIRREMEQQLKEPRKAA